MTEEFEVMDGVLADEEGSLPGTSLPERVLQEVLKAGFIAIHKDQTLIDELFSTLPQSVRNSIKEYYAGHEVTVRLNFPRDGITFPLVSILSGSDNEATDLDYLGGFEGAEFDSAYTTRVQALGHALRDDVQVFCMAGKDSNAVLWMYYLVKAILMVNMLTLEAHGLQNVTFSGRDVVLREDLFPEFTFARVLGLSFVSYFSVLVTERVAKALEVRVFTAEPFSDTPTQVNVEDP